MLSGIFQKRKKIQELRAPSLQDIKKFREIYGRHAEKRHVETPACFERSIYKAISCQKELHAIDFRQEDVTDPQIIALAETLVDMPLVSSLDLRDNRITDDGAKALLEVLRLQVIAAKTLPKTNPKTKKVLPSAPVPEFTRYVTNVNLKGNEISVAVLEEMVQYTELLKREDKRLEIRAALNQIDRNAMGGVDEEDFKAVVKLLTGTEPSKKEVRQLVSQSSVSGDTFQNSLALENVLLAKCSSSPSKKAACPPWEALVQVRHANIGSGSGAPSTPSRGMSPTRTLDSESVVHSSPGSSPVQVRARVQDSGGNIQTCNGQGVQGSTVAAAPSFPTVETTVMPLGTSISMPTPVPSTPRTASANRILTHTPESNDSTFRPRVDFRPPSSPPPPLPLARTMSPERRGTGGSIVSVSPKSRDGIEGTSASRASEDHPNAALAVPPLTRQESIDSQRGTIPTTPSVGSPMARDEYSIDLESWRDEDPFADYEEASSVRGGGREDGSVMDEMESRRSQDHSLSVTSKSSATSSNHFVAGTGSNTNHKGTAAASLESSYGESSNVDEAGLYLDAVRKRQQDDLSSLAYKARAENDGASTRDVSISSCQPMRQIPPGALVKNYVDMEEEAEEEASESYVLDVMKDGKPRNIAKLLHTEFKRGLPLLEFPGDVPFRNLVALLLSENKLRDLGLFKDCRFPCTTVVDLSRNLLSKISDDELACFPKLQVLDLSANRLKTISGLGKLYDIKALNLSGNLLRSVINIEHLVSLQMLRIRSNAITTASALRLLSLNKMLQHLDLDDNPLVEIDERQRRKVTVHILNIIPTLTTFGSVPIAGHHSKDKRKLANGDAPMGKSLLENEELPDLHSTWASNACDILQIVQDKEPEPSRHTYDDDDPYAENTLSGTSPTHPKKVSRDQQRQKDELRSQAVGYRSRDKAPPSPTRTKTSPFAFGPPLPPPPRKSPKKKPVVDRKLAQEQKRRASELSAPKHPPVDTDQLKQEQRRKSRPTFDVNMSVAERLQLVRDKSLRRTSTLTPHMESTSFQSKSEMASTNQYSKRESEHVPALVMEIRNPPSSPQRSRSKSPSVIEFRIEPLPSGSTRALGETENNQHVEAAHTSSAAQSELEVLQPPHVDPSIERKPSLKESNFLHSLAVSNFLSHAEEEISTAQTALNVLLSMCERSPTDLKKLNDYRGSLDALDILDERDSQDLFQRAKLHDDPSKVQECSRAFDDLSTLKRCIKELLRKLETHDPGSPTIRSYCSEVRSTELRDIIETCHEDSGSPQKDATVPEQQLQSLTASPAPSPPREDVAPPRSEHAANQTLHSRLFTNLKSDESLGDEPLAELPVQETVDAVSSTITVDDEFDFLSSDTSMFGDDGAVTVAAQDDTPCAVGTTDDDTEGGSMYSLDYPSGEGIEEASLENDYAKAKSTASPSPLFERSERSVSATSTDITQDIQNISNDDDGGDFDFDSELRLDEEPSTPVADSQDGSFGPDATPSRDSANADEAQNGIEWETEDEVADTNAPAVDVAEDGQQKIEWSTEKRVAGVTDPSLDQFDVQHTNTEENEQQDAEEDDIQYTPAEDQDAEVVEAPEEGAAEGDDDDDEEAETFGDWEKGFDPTTNHYFWFNHSSGESQWVPPEGWPYEVDTPFEEDGSGDAGDDGQEGEYDDDQAVGDQGGETEETVESYRAETEADDDFFSDQDLPDF